MLPCCPVLVAEEEGGVGSFTMTFGGGQARVLMNLSREYLLLFACAGKFHVIKTNTGKYKTEIKIHHDLAILITVHVFLPSHLGEFDH